MSMTSLPPDDDILDDSKMEVGDCCLFFELPDLDLRFSEVLGFLEPLPGESILLVPELPCGEPRRFLSFRFALLVVVVVPDGRIRFAFLSANGCCCIFTLVSQLIILLVLSSS